jgi:hypothetical protein
MPSKNHVNANRYSQIKRDKVHSPVFSKSNCNKVQFKYNDGEHAALELQDIFLSCDMRARSVIYESAGTNDGYNESGCGGIRNRVE